MRHHFHHCILYELLLENNSNSRKKIYLSIYKSVLITSPIGFDIVFTNVEPTSKRMPYNVVSKLFQRCFNVRNRRCMNVKQRQKSDVEFCFIFNIASTLFQRWSTTLKRRLSDVKCWLSLSCEKKIILSQLIFARNNFNKVSGLRPWPFSNNFPKLSNTVYTFAFSLWSEWQFSFCVK